MKGNKKVVIGISSLVILGIAGYFAYSFYKKQKQKKQEELDAIKSDAQSKVDAANAQAAADIEKAKGASELEQAKKYFVSYYKKPANEIPMLSYSDEYIINRWKALSSGSPTFKSEGKTFDTIKGTVYVPVSKDSGAINKFAYPKAAAKTVNVRSSAKVNNGSVNNQLGVVNYPNQIGKIIDMRKGESGDGYTWYKVQLTTGLLKAADNYVPNATSGWVREDTIDIKSK